MSHYYFRYKPVEFYKMGIRIYENGFGLLFNWALNTVV